MKHVASRRLMWWTAITMQCVSFCKRPSKFLHLKYTYSAEALYFQKTHTLIEARIWSDLWASLGTYWFRLSNEQCAVDENVCDSTTWCVRKQVHRTCLMIKRCRAILCQYWSRSACCCSWCRKTGVRATQLTETTETEANFCCCVGGGSGAGWYFTGIRSLASVASRCSHGTLAFFCVTQTMNVCPYTCARLSCRADRMRRAWRTCVCSSVRARVKSHNKRVAHFSTPSIVARGGNNFDFAVDDGNGHDELAWERFVCFRRIRSGTFASVSSVCMCVLYIGLSVCEIHLTICLVGNHYWPFNIGFVRCWSSAKQLLAWKTQFQFGHQLAAREWYKLLTMQST